MSRLVIAVGFLLVGLLAVQSSAVRAAPNALPAGFVRETVAIGLTAPTAFAFAGDEILVANKGGTVQIVNANGTVSPTLYATVKVTTDQESGLSGIAVHPGYPKKPFVYIYYTTGPGALKYDGHHSNRLSRFRTVNGVAGKEKILLDHIPSHTGVHNAGDIHFGFDGKMYVTVGDGGTDVDSPWLQSLSGKILRLNRDGTIPHDNPFYANPNVRPEIFAYGFRNPFRMTMRESNHSYLIADVGNHIWEEIDTLHAAKNYGWPTFEGPCKYDTVCNPAKTDFKDTVAPIYYYQHSPTPKTYNAIIGGAFAEHSIYPAPYANAYFYGDFAGWVKVLTMDRKNRVTGGYDFDTLALPTDFRMGTDGKLYVSSLADGALYRYGYTAN